MKNIVLPLMIMGILVGCSDSNKISTLSEEVNRSTSENITIENCSQDLVDDYNEVLATLRELGARPGYQEATLALREIDAFNNEHQNANCRSEHVIRDTVDDSGVIQGSTYSSQLVMINRIEINRRFRNPIRMYVGNTSNAGEYCGLGVHARVDNIIEEIDFLSDYENSPDFSGLGYEAFLHRTIQTVSSFQDQFPNLLCKRRDGSGLIRFDSRYLRRRVLEPLMSGLDEDDIDFQEILESLELQSPRLNLRRLHRVEIPRVRSRFVPRPTGPGFPSTGPYLPNQ